MPRKTIKQKEQEKVKEYQQRFTELCEEVKNGKLVKEEDTKGRKNKKTGIKGEDKLGRVYQEEYPELPITEENFVMAYAADLPDDNVFSTCRRQLPKQWFVSKAGEVIACEEKSGQHVWRWEKTQGGKERRKYRKQYGIRESMYESFEKNRPNFKTNKHRSKPKTPHAKNIESYVLTGIVYNAKVLGKRAKQILKEQGLDGLGNNPKGKGMLYKEGITLHHCYGYYEDENKSYSENMIYNHDTKHMIFMTNRVHHEIENLIHSINTVEDALHISDVLQRTLEEEDPEKIYVIQPYLMDEEHNIVDYNDYELSVDKYGISGEKITISAHNRPYADIAIVDKIEDVFGAIGVNKIHVNGYFVQDPVTGEALAFKNEKSVYHFAVLLKNKYGSDPGKCYIFEIRNKGGNMPLFGTLMRGLIKNVPNAYRWLLFLPLYDEYCRTGKLGDKVEVENAERDLKYTITLCTCDDNDLGEKTPKQVDGLFEFES